MAEVVIPPQLSPGMSSSHPDEQCDIDGNAGPFSLNQTFSFPPQQAYTTSPLHQDHNASISQLTTHRRKPSNLSLANLPPFDFGVIAPTGPLRPSPSPTRSPIRLTPPSHPQSGHKRAGSEFVGGDITGGGPVLVATSTSDDPRLPSAPSSPAKGPPSSRRGHAHRRSHAVSQSDIKFMMHPEAPVLTGSLPVTPLEEPKTFNFPAPQKATSHDGIRSHFHSRSSISSSLPGSASRARVDFSNTPEFISRPLSTISSETSSSMSTVRANHSISESVSSSHASGVSSPSSHRNAGVSGVSRGTDDRTDLATIDNASTAKVSKADCDTRLAGDVVREGGQAYVEPLQTPPDMIEDQDVANQANPLEFGGPCSSYPHSRPTLQDETESRSSLKSLDFARATRSLRPGTSPESKASGKPPRAKSWAENILHRKDRHDDGYTMPVAEANQYAAIDNLQEPQFSIEDISFDDDTTMIIEEPSAATTKKSTHLPFNGNSTLSPEMTAPSPMIDLDLAMDFSGLPNNSGGKRRLHSSGETGGFTGPGMHYHRRTESAPEMELFERPRLGFPRIGSNPAMEEAIVEEDEEGNSDSDTEETHTLGLGVNIVEEDFHRDVPSRQDSILRHNESRRVIRRISTPPDALPTFPIQIVDSEEEPRFSMITKSSDESSITPTVSPDPFGPRPVSAPLDFALQTPSLTYGTTPESRSAVSSADYRQTSFDFREHRLHTARSSMTDRVTLNSSRAGDMSGGSLDDVPSLTSSSSTVMSGFPPRNSGCHQTCDSSARSASFSGPTTARGRPGSSSKRASLASLSKLMGGTYNRSKLNIAETLRPDSPSPSKSQKKKHRISRMMKFWKSKESLSAR